MEHIDERNTYFYVQAKLYFYGRKIWEWATVSVKYDNITEADENMHKRRRMNDREEYRIIRVEELKIITTEVLDEDYVNDLRNIEAFNRYIQ